MSVCADLVSARIGKTRMLHSSLGCVTWTFCEVICQCSSIYSLSAELIVRPCSSIYSISAEMIAQDADMPSSCVTVLSCLCLSLSTDLLLCKLTQLADRHPSRLFVRDCAHVWVRDNFQRSIPKRPGSGVARGLFSMSSCARENEQRSIE